MAIREDLPADVMIGLIAERRETRGGLGIRAAEMASCKVPGRGKHDEDAKPDDQVPSRSEAEGSRCELRPGRRGGQRLQGPGPQGGVWTPGLLPSIFLPCIQPPIRPPTVHLLRRQACPGTFHMLEIQKEMRPAFHTFTELASTPSILVCTAQRAGRQ